MKSLRSYASYRTSEQDPDPAPDTNTTYDTVQSYLNLSQEERWKLLVSKVASSKAQGSLSDADLEKMVQTAKNLLSPEQYAEMQRLVGSLKEANAQ